MSIHALRIHNEGSVLLKSWRYLSQRWNNLPSTVDENAPSAHDETQQARRFVYFEYDLHAPAPRGSSVTGRPHYFNQVNWAIGRSREIVHHTWCKWYEHHNIFFLILSYLFILLFHVKWGFKIGALNFGSKWLIQIISYKTVAISLKACVIHFHLTFKCIDLCIHSFIHSFTVLSFYSFLCVFAC